MKITDISVQARNSSRVNVSVDGVYRFSLDIFQVTDLGIQVGKEYNEKQLVSLEEESVFGKLYAKTLEYTMLRPHSSKEIKEYLRKQTRDVRYKSRKTGEIKTRVGVSSDVTERVYDRLVEKGYIDDEKFAQYWVEHHSQRAGASFKKLRMELYSKGISTEVIDETVQKSTRDEKSEVRKMLQKKASKYDDERKLIAYLVRQGFSYDIVREVLAEDS